MKLYYSKLLLVVTCCLAACTAQKKSQLNNNVFRADKTPSKKVIKSWLADKKATDETAALFYNMKLSSTKQVLFGHMEDDRNGYDGWKNTPGRSDVYEVAGAYPVIYGYDFGGPASLRENKNAERDLALLRDQVVTAYKKNGIVTFSWHYNNPVTRGSFYWKQSPVNAVSEILPGAAYHKDFKASLAKIAAFAAMAKDNDKLVPIIFRPFHEFDGDWFWWGNTHCTTEDYKSLYRFTVTYLRDSLHVKNFLYGWSPDCKFDSQEKYTERYPGNDYVDVVGMDNYYDLRPGQSPSVAAGKLKVISDFAQQNNKVAALTETGLENVSQADWYTSMLLKALKTNPVQIAYVMLWSNRPNSYWTPHKGHAAEADFLTFKKDPYIAFSDKASSLYKLP